MRNKMIELISKLLYAHFHVKSNVPNVKGKVFGAWVDVHGFVDDLIANGAMLQQWIPVSEPPKEEGRYLCLDVDTGNYFDAYYDDAEQAFGEWRGIYDEGTLGLIDTEFCDYASVTHWMPLPELPKGE